MIPLPRDTWLYIVAFISITDSNIIFFRTSNDQSRPSELSNIYTLIRLRSKKKKMDDYVGYILVLALAGIFVFSLSNAFKKRDKAFLRSVVIVVLGDIGRSPRMMYHAESFATARFKTYVVGYGGEYITFSLDSFVNYYC